MMRFCLIVLFTFGVLSCEVAPIKQLEQVTVAPGELAIPYTKYRLANGLTLLVHEDKSDPLVHVDVTYHVGSAREEARRSGFAHFFEHMMFQGSKHVGDEEHFKIVTEAGGRMNGTTNFDRTNYFQTVPSNNLETMLWLEADRMGFLLEAVTQEKFEVQRATVKNERGQNYDNRPYGLFGEINFAALYPPTHPYSWPVIGFTEDLDAATLDDLKKFFLRWYGPNNATLTVGGNVDKEEVLRLVEKYFGAIPRGPEVKSAAYADPVLEQDRYVSYVDKNIRFPALLFTFPTVPYDHPDRVALECLNDIIGVGRKSYFYKQFVLTQKAIDASSFNNTFELGGSITFFVLPYPGTSLADFEAEMRELFDNFDADAISDDDIQIFKATNEAALARSLSSVRGKVGQLAIYETYLGDPDQITKELQAIRSLTKEDVLRVFNRYVKDRKAVIQSVLPEAPETAPAKPDNFELPERLQRLASKTADLEPRPVVDNFDRAQRPTPGPTPLVTVPKIWRAQLDNKVDIIGTQTDEVPLVTVRLSFEGGHLLNDPKKYGLASLTAAMMDEGTENFSAEEFEVELQKLGSSITVGSDSDSTQFTVLSLVDKLDETLALLEERLLRSKFTEADLQRLKQQTIEGLEANKKQPSSIAADSYRRLIYGRNHSFSVSPSGTVETVAQLSVEDVENFAQQNISASNLQVVVVGAIDQQSVLPKLAFLEKLPASALSQRSQPPAPTVEQTTLFFVDKPGAAQSEIRIGYLSDLPYDASGTYFKRYLMNYILGGAFNSRINLNLREDKGYTYGARSGFSGSKLPGPFTASASVLKEATADSIKQFMLEIENYRADGITEEELAFTRSAIGQSDALSYETPGQKAGFLARIIQYGLSEDYVDRQLEVINNISRDDINALAKQYLPTDKMIILVVGDKGTVFESLQELGYPIVQLDAEGALAN